MKHIILIGFMGCGKTTVGIRLSYRLRQVLEDTDKLIEKEQKRSISEIFAMEGEEAFRQMETECLKDLMNITEKRVIAVGGGLPLRPENRELLRELGKVVYLRATPETIYERLKSDTVRPLLQGEDPEGRIRSLLKVRSPLYEAAAEYIIDVDHKSMDDILLELEGINAKQCEV